MYLVYCLCSLESCIWFSDFTASSRAVIFLILIEMDCLCFINVILCIFFPFCSFNTCFTYSYWNTFVETIIHKSLMRRLVLLCTSSSFTIGFRSKCLKYCLLVFPSFIQSYHFILFDPVNHLILTAWDWSTVGVSLSTFKILRSANNSITKKKVQWIGKCPARQNHNLPFGDSILLGCVWFC